MVKAIIFDCFGVLTSDGWLPFKKKHFGHSQELTQQATDLNKQVDSGFSDYQTFITDVAELARVPRKEAREAIEDNVADEELFSYIQKELKPRYKIGLLSNAGDNWLDELFSPEQVALFDAVALSYDTGVVKPGKKAYETIAERLGVELNECIFIDDQERYCTAARSYGMQAIVYSDVSQLKQELERLLRQS